MTVRHADPRSSATVMSLRPAPFRKPVSNSSCHLEEHPARHAVQQQGVVFPGPPARKKTFRVMPDDNQVDLQGIGEARNLINGIASRKMACCDDVPLTELVHALLENFTGSLFVEVEVDRGQDIKPACPIRAVENRKQVGLGVQLLRKQCAAA